MMINAHMVEDLERKVFEGMLSSFCRNSGSAGYFGLMVDMDGRPWLVMSAVKDEGGLNTLSDISDMVMDYVTEHFPSDDKVLMDHRNTKEAIRKHLQEKKIKRAKDDFDSADIKN